MSIPLHLYWRGRIGQACRELLEIFEAGGHTCKPLVATLRAALPRAELNEYQARDIARLISAIADGAPNGATFSTLRRYAAKF